jgi:hypothetical protein
MGRSQKLKGEVGEREAADTLSEATGMMWRRTIGQTRRGGSEAPDVDCDDLPGTHCEVKRGKAISLWAALRQAIDDAGADRLPWVLARLDRGEWVVVVRLRDLLPLARRLWPGGWGR